MLLALMNLALAAPISRTLPADMPRLTVQADRADITIRTVAGADATVVTATPVNWSEGCTLDFEGGMDAAVVNVGLPDAFAPHCKTEIDIALAGATQVFVELERGHIQVDDPWAPLDLALGGGRVQGTTHGDAVIVVQRGRVHLDGLTVPVDVDVAAGGVLLEYDEAIPGTVAARVGLGRLRTRFPYGTWLNKDIDTVVGRTFVAIPTRTTSETHLVARTAMGTNRVETVLVDDLGGETVADHMP
ncbi:MAG: hypothetical protein GY913_31940 [Proteobacteria bacterium]|nr:hypothetical protein [Pseudomonadota bacterium]MCP4921532.1 hypothetical protein [Pseudomonadota bacterium]